MFRFSSTASVTLVEVGWLAPCNAKPVRARRFSFETGSEPSRFFRSETPRTIAQPTETWLLDRYAQPRLFFNDFHVRWTNLRGPARYRNLTLLESLRLLCSRCRRGWRWLVVLLSLVACPTLMSLHRRVRSVQAQCHACSAIHVVVNRCTAGKLSAKPAPMDFSSLPPTNGILTSTLTT